MEQKNHKKADSDEANPYNIRWDCDTPVVSSMECTGLIPALPGHTSELEAYEEMYQIYPFYSSAKDHSCKP